jgi:hypothetical protein
MANRQGALPPVSNHQHQPLRTNLCAMLISILAFLSCLLLVSSARAQLIAPNCTKNTYAWVGSVSQTPILDR